MLNNDKVQGNKQIKKKKQIKILTCKKLDSIYLGSPHTAQNKLNKTIYMEVYSASVRKPLYNKRNKI